MQPARFRRADFLLVEINNVMSTSPAVSSGEERGLLSRTAAGNRAYLRASPLYPPLQMDKYKEITGFDVYSVKTVNVLYHVYKHATA